MPDPLFLEGMRRQQAEDFAAAAQAYRQVIADAPSHAWAWHLIGTVKLEQGDAGRPKETGRAFAIDDREAAFHLADSEAASRAGDRPSAHRGARRAISLLPAASEGHAALAARGDEPLNRRLRARAIAPQEGGVWCNLGNAECEAGLLTEAARSLRRAIALMPAHVEILASAANAHIALAGIESAIGVAERAIAVDPLHAGARSNYAAALRRGLQFAAAAKQSRQALALMPALPAGLSEIAQLMLAVSRATVAVAWNRRALALLPDRLPIVSNFLFSLCYAAAGTPERLLAEAKRFIPRVGLPLSNRPRRENRRTLTIGYVSPDLGRHPVGYFLLPVLQNHDRRRVRAVCYSTRALLDELAMKLRAAADYWVDAAAIGDEQLARRIQADGVDILIDLAGHTAGARLGVFARRPAPVQATWAGYPGTTGLSQIDYIIADRVEIPSGAERWYSERVVRLPRSYVCFAPPVYSPDPGPPPSKESGRVTFGCFNNLAKLSGEVFGAWARILAQVPESRLVLRWPSLVDRGISDEIRGRLVASGIAAERMDLGGCAKHEDLLSAYRNVDIALDPFPYSGGLTTLESLWMGVPVITIAGAGFAGRHSASHLTAVGLEDFIADGVEDYMARAVAWAERPAELSQIRAGLRDRMRASTLCDGARFTRDLEAAYGEMWREADEAGADRNGSSAFDISSSSATK